jgi:hypothetical protein
MKNPTASAGLEPANLGTRDQHANHETTEAAQKIYGNEKIPMTLTEIEPATFRFVAQCLNPCVTACPLICTVRMLNFRNLRPIYRTGTPLSSKHTILGIFFNKYMY